MLRVMLRWSLGSVKQVEALRILLIGIGSPFVELLWGYSRRTRQLRGKSAGTTEGGTSGTREIGMIENFFF